MGPTALAPRLHMPISAKITGGRHGLINCWIISSRSVAASAQVYVPCIWAYVLSAKIIARIVQVVGKGSN